MISTQITQSAPIVPETPASEVSLFTFVEALFRHWKLFMSVAAVIMGLTCWWTFGTGRTYQSNASILVQNARSTMLISAGNSSMPTVTTDVTEEQLNSELEVLNSKDLLDEVIDPGWAKRPHSELTTSQLTVHERAVVALSRRLDASVPRQSHILMVKMKGATPEIARDQLQKLITAFMQRQRDIGRPAGAAKFFTEQAEAYRKQLLEAQVAMAKFQEQQKVVNVSDKEKMLADKLSLMEAARRDADLRYSDLQARVEADTALLRTTPARQPTLVRQTPLAGAVDQLTTKLVALKNERTELLNKYKPTDRMVKQVEDKIADTEQGLASAIAVKSQDASTDINPTWQQLQSDLTMAKAELSSTRARRTLLLTQLAELQTTLNSLEGLSPEFSELQHKVTELDSNYESFLQKRDEADIADKMDRQDLINFALVQAPTYPFIPEHPRPLRDMLMGAISALLLACVAVFLAESMRDTAGTAAELERWSRYPALATIPWVKGDAGFKEPFQSEAGAVTHNASDVENSDAADNFPYPLVPQGTRRAYGDRG